MKIMNTFRLISRTIAVYGCVLLTMFLVSCEEIGGAAWERPDDMSPYIPDYCMTFTGSWSISGNTAYFNIEPRVIADFDYWQLEIKSIDYYIDNTLIKTDTEEPYSLVYTAPALSEGRHQLVASVKIENLVNHKEIVVNPTKDFEITSASQPDMPNGQGMTISASWSKSGNNVYFNISNVKIWDSLVDSGWTLTSVNFYFDDELIDTAYEEPFSLTYMARNLYKGMHYLIIQGKVVNTFNSQEVELFKKIEIEIS